MRSPGSSDELERRRHLAVQRVLEGDPIEDVADFLGVHRTTVSRWMSAVRARGIPGLAARSGPRRTPRTKLAAAKQEPGRGRKSQS